MLSRRPYAYVFKHHLLVMNLKISLKISCHILHGAEDLRTFSGARRDSREYDVPKTSKTVPSQAGTAQVSGTALVLPILTDPLKWSIKDQLKW